MFHFTSKVVLGFRPSRFSGSNVRVAGWIARARHLIQSYYRATVEVLSFRFRKMHTGVKVAKDHVITVLSSLKKLGFRVDLDETKISKLVDMLVEDEQCCDC